MSWYWLEARRMEEERDLLGKNLLFLLCWQQGLGFHLQTGSMVHLGWAGCSVLGAWAVCASPGHNVLISSGKTVRWIVVLNWALLCPSMESLPFILIWGSTTYRLCGASSSIHTAGSGIINTEYFLFIFLAGIVSVSCSAKFWVWVWLIQDKWPGKKIKENKREN